MWQNKNPTGSLQCGGDGTPTYTWNTDVYSLSLFSNSEDGTTHYFLFLPILDTFISLRFEHKLGKHTEGMTWILSSTWQHTTVGVWVHRDHAPWITIPIIFSESGRCQGSKWIDSLKLHEMSERSESIPPKISCPWPAQGSNADPTPSSTLWAPTWSQNLLVLSE